MTSAHDSHAHSRTAVVLAVVVAVACGALTAVQSRVNAQLALDIHDGIVAAAISFGSGLVILAIAVLAFRPARVGLGTLRDAVASRRIPWWYLTGGVCGAFFVVTQGLSAAVIGVALFTIAAVAGQTLSGAIIDSRGIGTMAARPVTVPRILAGLLAVAAVVLAGSSELRSDVPVQLVVLPLVAGALSGWQQAVNGQTRAASGSTLAATFLNFVLGTALLLVAGAVRVAFVGLPSELPTNPLVYSGGLIGVMFIFGSVAIVRITGVLLLSLGTIAGQLIGATLLDVFVPVEGHKLSALTVLGTAITLVAVTIAALSGRRRAHSTER
jgi:transporter family-2 protein